ncbi:MAG: ribbon-helix-helix protein, CopG family [Candidatus Bathyarchaeota archaeon]|nr:MAG: ribbon-helix-helix protein, CopG family [Candidatus Bathyarchaeota archaeon]
MNKDKISIALTKSLLKQINSECKKTGLSRSSYIEMILRQYCRTYLIEKKVEHHTTILEPLIS